MKVLETEPEADDGWELESMRIAITNKQHQLHNNNSTRLIVLFCVAIFVFVFVLVLETITLIINKLLGLARSKPLIYW